MYFFFAYCECYLIDINIKKYKLNVYCLTWKCEVCIIIIFLFKYYYFQLTIDMTHHAAHQKWTNKDVCQKTYRILLLHTSD